MEQQLREFLGAALARRAVQVGGCIELTGGGDHEMGYPRIRIPARLAGGRPRAIFARRAAWMLDRGISISDGRTPLVHIWNRCRNERCVDPSHLRCPAMGE